MAVSIMVTSGKGGTGKTSLVGGLGSCLAALGHPTLCIDLDVGLRNLDITLGLTDRALMDFSDVIAGRCSLERAVAAHPEVGGLYMLTAPMKLDPGVTAERMAALVAAAKERFDYVLLDCPAGLGFGFQLAQAAADRGILVATTDPSSLRDAQTTVMAVSPEIPLQMVVNRVSSKFLRGVGTNLDLAINTVGVPLLGVVPEDPAVAISAGKGRPLILMAHRGAALAYLNIAKRLTGQRVALSMK